MPKCYTIGHSTWSIEEFITLLKRQGIEVLVDIRAFPGSRRFPHFKKEYLEPSLYRENIAYIWRGKEFGGYRDKSFGLGESSPNRGWKSKGFHFYADYMLSEDFQNAAQKLIELAEKKAVACMCAEVSHRRCHRQLLSDFLLSRGVEVWHIEQKGTLLRHKLTDFARITDGQLTYPPSEPDLFP